MSYLSFRPVHLQLVHLPHHRYQGLADVFGGIMASSYSFLVVDSNEELLFPSKTTRSWMGEKWEKRLDRERFFDPIGSATFD